MEMVLNETLSLLKWLYAFLQMQMVLGRTSALRGKKKQQLLEPIFKSARKLLINMTADMTDDWQENAALLLCKTCLNTLIFYLFLW